MDYIQELGKQASGSVMQNDITGVKECICNNMKARSDQFVEFHAATGFFYVADQLWWIKNVEIVTFARSSNVIMVGIKRTLVLRVEDLHEINITYIKIILRMLFLLQTSASQGLCKKYGDDLRKAIEM